MDNFTKFLLQSSKEIEKELSLLFTHWESLVTAQTPQLSAYNALFAQRITGGKNIRGALVLLGYKLNTSSHNTDIKKIAAAFEILHTSLLIHDDIIDKTTIRRGKSTIHTQLGNKHYGLSVALCLGDIGFFLAQKIIADTIFDEKRKNKALYFFSQIVLETILGELLDVKLSNSSSLKYEKDVLLVHKLKTAYYTIVGPLLLGATLGNASVKQIAAIKQFGEYAGIAFQIQDDILGVFGDEQTLGKSTTSDIEENKNTLLITYAYQHANAEQKKVLKTVYGKNTITSKQHEVIKYIFEQTGALSYSQQKAESYIEKAIQQIPTMTKDKKLQTLLLEFSNFITQRQQ